jgi:cytochrome b
MTLTSNKPSRARVWDIPVRIFHWGLAGCFIVGWLTLDNRYLDIHVFSGYLMAGLVSFRVLWGIIGSPYARFHDFAFTWGAVKEYLKGITLRSPPRFLGHNPAGSWAIYAMLGLGLLIVISGLLALGGEERHGPLAGWINYPLGSLAHATHEVFAWLMMGLVLLHLLGVAIESYLHRENLIAAMLTGHKSASAGSESAPSHWLLGVIMGMAMLISGLAYFQGHITATPEQPYLPFRGPELADNPLWREECGSCHLAFHPSLLPARSWKAMMAGQASHFEEDLALEAETITEIEAFLVINAAEQAMTEAAWKINRGIPQAETPLRITETTYWLKKHEELSVSVWDNPLVKGKTNCAACHMDAEQGTYEDAAMRLPAGITTATKNR